MTFWEYPNKFEAESIQNYKSYECCCKKTDFFLNFSLSKFFPHPQITSEKKIGFYFRNVTFCLRIIFQSKLCIQSVEELCKVGWGFLDPMWGMCDFSEMWMIRVKIFYIWV